MNNNAEEFMKARTIIAIIAIVCCTFSIAAVIRTQRRVAAAQVAVAEAQAAHARLQAELQAAATNARLTAPEVGPTVPASQGVPSELLRLRAEVTRLNVRKAELTAISSQPHSPQNPGTGVTRSNEKQIRLPPGYIRTTAAQFLGYQSPDATLQTFLWAVNNQDTGKFLNCFSPEVAENLRRQMEQTGAEEFMKKGKSLPGLLIQNRTQAGDDRVQLQVEFVPGMPVQTMTMQFIKGEWKIMTKP